MNSESLARETGPQFNPLRSSTSDGSLRVAMSGAVPALWCRAVGALDTLKIGWMAGRIARGETLADRFARPSKALEELDGGREVMLEVMPARMCSS
jgi:hypothetical protein